MSFAFSFKSNHSNVSTLLPFQHPHGDTYSSFVLSVSRPVIGSKTCAEKWLEWEANSGVSADSKSKFSVKSFIRSTSRWDEADCIGDGWCRRWWRSRRTSNRRISWERVSFRWKCAFKMGQLILNVQFYHNWSVSGPNEANNLSTRNTCCSCGRSDATGASSNTADGPCATNIHAAVKLVWRQSFGCRWEYRWRRGLTIG